MARFRKNDFFKWAQKIKSVFCFNPYTHEGCDPCRRHKARPIPCFNPHTHEGCDKLSLYTLVLCFVSIHTPTKGVTYIDAEAVHNWSFQSTHPRRV